MFSFMALALAMLAQEAPVAATSGTTSTTTAPATDAPVEPRIICKNIEVTGSRLAKKKKVCLPEGEWSESARRNMKSGSRGGGQ